MLLDPQGNPVTKTVDADDGVSSGTLGKVEQGFYQSSRSRSVTAVQRQLKDYSPVDITDEHVIEVKEEARIGAPLRYYKLIEETLLSDGHFLGVLKSTMDAVASCPRVIKPKKGKEADAFAIAAAKFIERMLETVNLKDILLWIAYGEFYPTVQEIELMRVSPDDTDYDDIFAEAGMVGWKPVVLKKVKQMPTR